MKKTNQTKRMLSDDAPLSPAELATARPLRDVFPDLAAYGRARARKQAVSIRLSPEVIAFFKAKGRGWQTRIDAALRAIVEAAR